MDFLDGIEKKIVQDKDQYKNQEYVFSDGEGAEEGDFMMDEDQKDYSGSE